MNKIRYLPLASKDLENIILYIADNLKNPKAAKDLTYDFDASISQLQKFPYMGKIYQSIHKFTIEYRVIQVNSYLVFYTMVEREIEIHRVIYSKMNLEDLIK